MRRRLAAIALAGLGVGWLVGLSQSPVIAAVLAALITAVAALIGPAATRREGAPPAAIPAAALVIGIALGASAGLYTRTHSWLSGEPSAAATDQEAVDRWVRLGLPRDEVIRRLFDRELPAVAATTASERSATPAPRMPAGLVGEDAGDECAGFRASRDDQLWLQLRASSRGAVRNLAAALANSNTPATVARLVVEVACPSGR